MFRNHKIESQYKPSRFHILFGLRLLANQSSLPPMNAGAIDSYCGTINSILWDTGKADELFGRAIKAVEDAAGGTFDRDIIRTLPFTERVAKACGVTTGPLSL